MGRGGNDDAACSLLARHPTRRALLIPPTHTPHFRTINHAEEEAAVPAACGDDGMMTMTGEGTEITRGGRAAGAAAGSVSAMDARGTSIGTRSVERTGRRILRVGMIPVEEEAAVASVVGGHPPHPRPPRPCPLLPHAARQALSKPEGEHNPNLLPPPQP